MLRNFCVFCVFLFISSQASAIKAIVSNTVFYLPDSVNQDKLLPYVETSWEITPYTLHFISTPDKAIIAQIKTDIVYTKNSIVIAEYHFIVQTPPRANVTEIGTHKIINLRRYFLEEGNILMTLKFTDLNDTSNVFITTDSFNIPEPQKTTFYSKLQLLDTTTESTNQTVFTKNGIEQIPLNNFFLDNNRNTLIYYGELYRTKQISKKDLPLIQKVFISKKEFGSPYQFFNQIDTLSVQEITLVSGYFNIGSLLSGNYYLNVTLETNNHLKIASSSLFFQRLNKHPSNEDSARKIAADTSLEKINVLNLDKTFVSKFNLEQLRAILKMLLPLTDPMGTQTIQGFLEKPEEMYIRYYIYNFFLAINPKNPAKAWKEYSDRVIQVNKLFKGLGKQGYDTERGFYYLRYGEPTEIITVENEPGALPYEIWQYNTLTQTNHKDITNAVLLFYKPNLAIDDYILLHCTIGGETQNMNWRGQLYVNGSSSGSRNNRVEQYLGGNR